MCNHKLKVQKFNAGMQYHDQNNVCIVCMPVEMWQVTIYRNCYFYFLKVIDYFVTFFQIPK